MTLLSQTLEVWQARLEALRPVVLEAHRLQTAIYALNGALFAAQVTPKKGRSPTRADPAMALIAARPGLRARGRRS